MAVHVYHWPEGAREPVRVEEDHNDLSALQRLVGGYVELVTCEGGIDAFCDEDGRMRQRRPTVAVLRRGGGTVVLRGSIVFVVPRAKSPEDSAARVRLIAWPLPGSQSMATDRPHPR